LYGSSLVLLKDEQKFMLGAQYSKQEPLSDSSQRGLLRISCARPSGNGKTKNQAGKPRLESDEDRCLDWDPKTCGNKP
jgi:hypothetical protein